MSTIAVSMAAGLSYMHQSSTSTSDISSASTKTSYKPKYSIAHRDFKSKNILIKNDMNACIADFGLALVLDNRLGEIHSQVGTPRYMAPEVLEGAISFTPAAFLCIDAFAFAMVLWELVSRLQISSSDDAEPYRLPFEQSVGSNPTVAQMKEVVVVRKERPIIPTHLLSNKFVIPIIETIHDCWDQDADSRLSVMCAYVRLRELMNLQYIGAASE